MWPRTPAGGHGQVDSSRVSGKTVTRGSRDFADGAAFILKRAHLWKWIVFPAVVTFLLILGLGILGYRVAGPGIDTVVGWLPSWLGFLGTVLRILVVGLMLVVGYIIFLAVASVIASPFN